MSELVTIYLCRVDLNSRYDHSIHFNSRSEQSTFFHNHKILTTSNYTHVRRSWDLQLSFPYDQIQDVNYLFFNQGGRAWYYFINSFEYKNEGSTTLNLELDVIQTYMFDWDLKPCFVERQHTMTDNLYDHTIDEGLECGELINRGERQITEMTELCCLVFATIDPQTTIEAGKKRYTMRCVWDNVFSGIGIYVVESSDFDNLGAKLETLADLGFLDGIISMHMYPKCLIRLSPNYSWGDGITFKPVLGSTYLEIDDVEREVTNRAYTPKNNKLYCYPYNMLCVSNNNGQTAVYKFERFNVDGDLSFRIIGGLTADSGCKIIPHAYNTVLTQYNDEEGLTITGFPSCAWDSDTYKIWLAQNQNQHALTTFDANVKKATALGSGLAGAIGSAVSGDIGGIFSSGANAVGGFYQASMQIQGLVAQKNDMAITPPQAKGNFSPTLNVAHGYQQFSFIYKTVTDENAKIIDNYFTMYGYKLNRIGTPQLRVRKSHTYIKTVGAIVGGDFNNNDKLRIASIFDKGITFWVNGDDIGNYDADNSCL